MILIALGSNLTGPWGTPGETLLRAIAEMPCHNIRVLNTSTFIETAPYGVVNQPNFVNAVVAVRTALSPEILLRALHLIEARAGRKRLKRWGPRTLDLDILDYNGQIRKSARTDIKPLVLPHPGIAFRSFVLAPITEVAPRWKHPVTHQSAAFTLRKLNGLNAN
jgi:2-amino-4-hydroxy-6-hydroxymethyldihydropteridine diphosphokinase